MEATARTVRCAVCKGAAGWAAEGVVEGGRSTLVVVARWGLSLTLTVLAGWASPGEPMMMTAPAPAPAPPVSCACVHPGRVALLNDFEAVGYGIPALQPEDLVPLNGTAPQPKVRTHAQATRRAQLQPQPQPPLRKDTSLRLPACVGARPAPGGDRMRHHRSSVLSAHACIWHVGKHAARRGTDAPLRRCRAACPQAPKVVTGPGTGLGAAQLMWDEGAQAYKVWPGADGRRAAGGGGTHVPMGYVDEGVDVGKGAGPRRLRAALLGHAWRWRGRLAACERGASQGKRVPR